MVTLDDLLEHTEQPYLGRASGRPFLKWAGGKRTLVPEIAKLLPKQIVTYWEPFVGGGAVFFAVDSRIHTAKLSDINAELALTYQVVRNKLDDLVNRLKQHAVQHSNAKYYYRVRKAVVSEDPVEVAARFIYLNKTCYNGLYRVNKKGLFNVPRGDYANPVVCDEDTLTGANKALQKATIRYGDFGRIEPGLNDFIYCDPPYDGTFSGYDAGGFGEEEHRRLRDSVVKWQKQGASVMISNADTPLIRSLYGPDSFTIYEMSAPRAINCNGSGRGHSSELLITTYAIS